MKKVVKILSLPARHPYTSKLNSREIVFVNPDTDLFCQGQCSPKYLDKNYPFTTYDLVHIHFSFDRLTLKEFESVLKYFTRKKRPIVWTMHSKECQRIRNYGDGSYQKLIFNFADKIICPTYGAKKWLENNFGKHKNDISVIPLGFMSDPRDIERLKKKVRKDPKLFTMLIGEFRQNKEFIQSIVNFLQCSALRDCRLQLIYKPIPLLNKVGKINPEIAFFYNLTSNSRIENLSLPEISNDLLNKAFLKSHAIIIANKWGTHSGQIELSKDCGCYTIVSDVGFYKEQWEKVHLFQYIESDPLKTAKNYTETLLKVSKLPSIEPIGMSRLDELTDCIKEHLQIYMKLLSIFKK